MGNYYELSTTGRVVSLDPGGTDLFVAVYGEERGEAVSCSVKEWYTIATKARKKRETWLNR